MDDALRAPASAVDNSTELPTAMPFAHMPTASTTFIEPMNTRYKVTQ
jgi:hypothetical protein